jgi:NADH:ubiquinone oxidoreductase subunit 6 (subunit J)
MTSLFNFLNTNLFFFSFLFFLGFLFLITALFAILTESSVHAILYLMFLFLYLTELTILLKMEFLALVFIIIYIGAVCVLMLFHIKLIKTFVHRFDNINNKELFLPVLIVSIILPLIQIITLSLEKTEDEFKKSISIFKSIPNYIKKEQEEENLRNNFNSNKISLERLITNYENYISNTKISLKIESLYLNYFSSVYKLSLEELKLTYKNYKNILDYKNNIENYKISLDKLIPNNITKLVEERYLINNIHFNYTGWIELFERIKSEEILGFLLYNVHFIYLIFGSFILLIAMLGSIFLTLVERKKKEFQNLEQQIFSEIPKSLFLKRTPKKKLTLK